MVRDTSNWAASSKTGQKAAATASLNALSAAKALLGPLDYVTWVDKFGVFIATEGDFREHAKVADGASDVLTSIFWSGQAFESCCAGCRKLTSSRTNPNWNFFSKSNPPIFIDLVDKFPRKRRLANNWTAVGALCTNLRGTEPGALPAPRIISSIRCIWRTRTIARHPFKSSLFLALHPPKLSRRSPKQPAEMTS
jgi:hypothetical protein